MATPLNAITFSGKIFQWGKNQHKAFEEMKWKISQAPILAFPNFKNPFELDMNASGYDMGVVLMQGGKWECYHSKIFHNGVLNYHKYDN